MLFSLTLCDAGRPVAGQTCLIHRGEMVGQNLYREDDKNSGIGNRLVHLTFCWAKEKGLSAIDIGGGHDYKRKFAPQRAERYEFTIAPPATYFAHRAANSVIWRWRTLTG